MSHDLVVRADDGDIAITDGTIAALGPELAGAHTEIDARGLLVMPGAIDAHVHLNDPGRAHWEGFDTGTRALALGGVTCAVDMPLNAIPPTIDAAGFDAKVAAARGRARIDFALWGGMVPGDLARMDGLAERGVVGFKAFMCPSGVDEFPAVDADTLGRGMERAAALGLPVAVHAEDPATIAAAPPSGGARDMDAWGASRPIVAELAAVETALTLARETGCALHVVHVSSAAAVGMIARARADGVDVTCEVCPHHLILDDGDARRLGALGKCAPPLRSSSERAALWASVAAGHVDLIASDHSPAPPDMKRGHDMFATWGGIAGAQTTLPLALTHGPANGVSHRRVSALLAEHPAARLGLAHKGRIAVGADADLALVRLDDPWVLREEDLAYRHRQSAFVGHTLTARVVRTILRGVTVAGEGAQDGPCIGRLVTSRRAANA